MTVIVAVRHKKKIYMGADSRISSEEFCMTTMNPKIIKSNGINNSNYLFI